MENLYSEESYKILKKQKNFILLISLLIFILSITLVGLSWLIVNPTNFEIIKIIASIFLSIVACAFFYCLLEKFLPKNRRAKFIYHLLTTNRYEDKFMILSIGKKTVLSKDIYCYEIEAIDSKNNRIILYIEEEFLSLLKENRINKMIISQNVIMAVEGVK